MVSHGLPCIDFASTGPHCILFYASLAINTLFHGQRPPWKAIVGTEFIRWTLTTARERTIPRLPQNPIPEISIYLYCLCLSYPHNERMNSLVPSHFYDQLSTSARTAAYLLIRLDIRRSHNWPSKTHVINACACAWGRYIPSQSSVRNCYNMHTANAVPWRQVVSVSASSFCTLPIRTFAAPAGYCLCCSQALMHLTAYVS